MKIDFVKTLEASSPYTPGRIYFEESTSLIKVATANNQYRVFGGVRSADYDATTQTLTIQNGNGDEVYLDMSEYVKQDSIIYNGNAKIFYGTCSTAAATTQKDVVCSSFTADDLVKGALIFVTFDNTNSGAAASLTMSVNNTTAKPIKKILTTSTPADLTNKGELRANETYLFSYDGTNWVCMTLDYYASDTYKVRQYQSGDNAAGTAPEYPLLSRYDITNKNATYDSNYARFYTGTTLNTNTGALTATSFIKSGGTSSQFLKADGTVDSNSYITSSDIPAMTTDASVAAWGYLKADDVSTKVDKSNAVSSLSLAMNSSTYTITLSGAMADGSTFTVGDPIDLPLETMVVDGSYNSSTKKVSLGLKNGSSVEFSVADLVAGLQTEITSSNKLSADLIQDGTTNKIVTATDKNKWNNLVSNVQADWNATTGLGVILNKPVIPDDASVAAWGYTKNALTGVTFNNTAATVTNGIASITANVLPDVTSSDNGNFLYVANNNGTYEWQKTNILNYSYNSNCLTSNRPININGTPNSLWIDNDYIEMSNISDWSWIRNIYFTPTGGTTVVNLQDYVNKRAGDSGEGLFAMVRNSSDGLYWDDSYHVLAYSSGSLNYQEWNGVFTTTGSFGNTNISTSGITKTNYSDWSWLTIEYRSGGTTVTENLQDYLDFRCLPEANSENIGAIPSVHYTTELGYHWEESGFGINYSTNIMEAPVFGGYSAANTSTTFKLDGTGLNSSAHSNWSWISRLSGNNKVTLQDTLDTKAPLASPALTGTPTAPTAATNTNNTQIATTAFVKSVLPTVNNATLTIQKNGTNVNTFTANSSSNVTANIQVNELPTVTASDNGKILRVVSGAWSLVNPNVIYSGSGTPSNSIGNDGDIYLQS